MSFDLEIKNSIASLQASVQALTASSDKAQASLARMGSQAAQTTTQTTSVAKSVGQIGQAATAAGGPVAGMMTRLGGLVAINPMAIAAGLGIGAITAGVYKLVEVLKEANAERDRLSQPIGTAAADDAITDARGKLDPAALRARVAPEQSAAQISARGAAVATRWLADMPEWARAGAASPSEIGARFVTPEDLQADRYAAESVEGRAASAIEARQAREAGYLFEIERVSIVIEAGQAPRAISTGAAESVLQTGKSDAADELRKIDAGIQALIRESRQANRSKAEKASNEAARADLNARRDLIIYANTMSQEYGQ